MGETRDERARSEAMCVQELTEAGALQVEIAPRCRTANDSDNAQVVYVPAFAIDATEVTLQAYGECVAAMRCAPLWPWLARRAEHEPFHPVEGVSFSDAADYCAFAGGRLPSEAEWERAARGLGQRLYPWGKYFVRGRANHGQLARGPRARRGDAPDDGIPDASDGYTTSAAVSSFPDGKSPYGLYDMAGNVWEWTTGLYAGRLPQTLDNFDPRGTSAGDERVVRGGSYLSPPSQLRVTARLPLSPDARVASVGFRCVYEPSR